MLNLLLAAVFSLNGDWVLRYFPQPDGCAVRMPAEVPAEARTVAAVVPGNCELDLVRAGVLPEPEVGLNVQKFRAYEGYQWFYTKSFVWESGEAGVCAQLRTELVFDGIDTLADVFLNGEKIGETENMFVSHRFDVTDRLKTGTNVVQVLLRSVLLDSKRQTLGELGYTMTGGAEGEPYRKAGHMGGWDIFPRLFVSGLWRDVRLETSGPLRIDQTSWIVKSVDLAARKAELVGSCRIDMPMSVLDKATVRVGLRHGGKIVAERTYKAHHFHQSFGLTVDNADFWWPRGFGEPTLYEAFVTVDDGAGTVVTHEERIGLRTVELVRDDVYGPDRPDAEPTDVPREHLAVLADQRDLGVVEWLRAHPARPPAFEPRHPVPLPLRVVVTPKMDLLVCPTIGDHPLGGDLAVLREARPQPCPPPQGERRPHAAPDLDARARRLP